MKNVQLWISEVIKKTADQISEESLHIQSYCIMGVVTDIRVPSIHPNFDGQLESNRPVLYDIDDGTGVVKVVQFVDNQKYNLPKENGATDFCTERQKGVHPLFNKVSNLRKLSPFPIGSCVEAKGKIQMYRDRPEILAFQVRIVSDARLEVDRMIRLKTISKKRIYDECPMIES